MPTKIFQADDDSDKAVTGGRASPSLCPTFVCSTDVSYSKETTPLRLASQRQLPWRQSTHVRQDMRQQRSIYSHSGIEFIRCEAPATARCSFFGGSKCLRLSTAAYSVSATSDRRRDDCVISNLCDFCISNVGASVTSATATSAIPHRRHLRRQL